MKRAIRRLVSKLNGRNKYIFFIVLAMICIVALSLGIYTQFFYQYSETDPLMMGINIGAQKTAEECAMLEAEFNNLFKNDILINSENVRTDKIEPDKPLVYNGYNLVNEDETYYSVNAQIPVINIDTETGKAINAEIRKDFLEKANSVMRQTEQNIIYNVTYQAFVNKDVLSVVVKASLKEGNKPEKVSIKTYNYSIPDKRRVTLENLIDVKNRTKEDVQALINNEIKTAYNNAKIIAAEYGSMYERDLKSDMYKIENTTNYFLTQDGYIYIIYCYGNNDYTNEMDIIIF
ncbi:MAG: hypothetical protein HFJ46_05435 [Clostridia bacterium]|nr:hypothetical protein [Clostridia bacterium]